jgi:hypothetical protein
MAEPAFTVSERDHEMAEQWWSDTLEDPVTAEDFSDLWILCNLLAQARAEGPREPTPGYRSKWRDRCRQSCA